MARARPCCASRRCAPRRSCRRFQQRFCLRGMTVVGEVEELVAPAAEVAVMPELTLLEALTKLGDTEAEVAQTPRNGGWKGKPLDACACPFATYLVAMGFGVACLDQEFASVDSDEEVRTPSPVSEFITAFDLGRHAELVSEAPIHWPPRAP